MENNNLNSLPFLLQKLCDEKDKTVRQVALAANIGESTLYRFVQGQSGLQSHTAKALNHYFEVDSFKQCIYKDGNLIKTTAKPKKKYNRANQFNVGDVVKNLHDRMIKSIIKVKFNKEKQCWEYLLVGEQEYIEEQYLKEIKAPKINFPQPDLQTKTVVTEILERAAEKLEEPISEPEEEAPVLEPILESEETQEPEVEVVPVNNHNKAAAVEDKSKELKRVILSIVEQLLCLL